MSSSGSARDIGANVVQTIRYRALVGNLAALQSGVRIGRIPLRAFISKISWHKVAAFNSTTSDTMSLGTSAAGVDILAATTVHDTGFVNHTAAAGLGLAVTATDDTDIFAKLIPGTAGTATTGDATITIEFIADHDG